MSGFISTQGPNEVCLLTDGAGYDKNGVIVTLGRKVTIGKVAPIAVTTRGNQRIGQLHQKRCCDAADKMGVDFLLSCFEQALPELVTSPEHDGWDFMHWHICAWSETRGLVRFSAHNLPFAFADGEEPFKLTRADPLRAYSAATSASMKTLLEAGVTPPMSGESMVRYMERVGGAMMEAQRRTAAPPLQNEVRHEPKYLIGGQCDLTIVTRHGAEVKTLRTWPDRIGEKIDPFSEVGNAIRLPRYQRRALEREQRKLQRRRA